MHLPFNARRTALARHALAAVLVFCAATAMPQNPFQNQTGSGGSGRQRPANNNNSNNNNSGNNANNSGNSGGANNNRGNNAGNNNQDGQGNNQRRRNNQNQGNNEGQQANQQQPGGNRPAAAAPAAAAPKAPSGPALGEFSVRVDQSSRMLVIRPQGKNDRQDISLIVGQELVTDISFDNKDLAGFDQFRVFLSYDPEYLEPLAINDSAIASSLKDAPVAEVDPVSGMILYEARLATPFVTNNSPILSVRWKTLKVTHSTAIEFSSRDDLYTVLVGEGKDLLGSPLQPGDGTLNMAATILPEDPREAQALLSDPTLFGGGGAKVGGARLYLKPPESTPVVGETFAVEVMFDNRAFSNADDLAVLIAYDPLVFEVLDADRDNYITIGRNILDGPFHDRFPWSFHIDNVVYQSRGLISYRKGTGDETMLRGKVGPFARIYMRPIKPTAGSAMTFKFNREVRGNGTHVTFNGVDALGDPKVFADGARGIIIPVLAPSSIAAMTASGETGG